VPSQLGAALRSPFVIVDCAAYIDGERVTAQLGLDEVAQWIARPDAFVWLGLRMPDRDEVSKVAAVCGMDDLDVDDAIAPHDRPVLTNAGDATWLVLRTGEYHDKLEKVLLGELSVLFTTHFIVTVRYGHASPLDGVRRELETDPERELLRHGVAGVVAAIVRRIVDDYRPMLDGFEKDVLEAEQQVFGDARNRPVRRLYELKRQILELLVVVDALHDPLERLTRNNVQLRDPEIHDELLLATDQLARIVRRIGTLSDLVTTAIDTNLTQVSLQQNEDMRRISAWVAIAAVPTAIAGIYGMNFKELPELEWDFGYPAVLLAMAAICVLLYRAFRRSGWL
jgi:magnesium transporter